VDEFVPRQRGNTMRTTSDAERYRLQQARDMLERLVHDGALEIVIAENGERAYRPKLESTLAVNGDHA